MTTRLILLPRDAAAPVPCLRLDREGKVVERTTLRAAERLAKAPGVRDIVVAPGDTVRALWLELPARSRAQAVAAARILVEERVADVGESTHVAVADGSASDAVRPVVVVAESRMREWALRCTQLGVAADALHAEQLLDRHDGGALRVMVRDGLWLVRGPQLAFVAEPELARQVVGDQPIELIDDPSVVEAVMARAAVHAHPEQVDLLQHAHDAGDTAVPRRQRRRMAVLGALCVLSPLLLLAADWAHHAARTYWLKERANAVAGFKLGDSSRGANASARLHRVYLERVAPNVLAMHATALFDAVKQLPGAQLDSLEYGVDAGVSAGVLHRNEAELDALRVQLASKGLELVPGESQAIDGGVRTRVTMRQVP